MTAVNVLNHFAKNSYRIQDRISRTKKNNNNTCVIEEMGHQHVMTNFYFNFQFLNEWSHFKHIVNVVSKFFMTGLQNQRQKPSLHHKKHDYTFYLQVL